MNYLIVVAHPDDEILGAGATIHKLISEGNKVAVAIMVSQAAARKDLSSTLSDDEKEALSIVGVEKTYHASFPNIKMNTVSHLELVQFVESCIEDWSADAIITHHPSDTNNDHVQTSCLQLSNLTEPEKTLSQIEFFRKQDIMLMEMRIHMMLLWKKKL